MGTSNQGKRSEAGANIKRPQNLYGKYHAHVYFDAATTEQAHALCQQAAA